ncbi:hypothetical protein HDU87_004088 [Geranomyces variabilis]|uniref:Methyltransferase small domain-containing protein n=1 Tax=Geranomyces variabilis TaxID=109894 RepID=A0AAD5TU21_9FUNG|nr:hypothetical protein HDU87_004088 [Geranomyces variabilis]
MLAATRRVLAHPSPTSSSPTSAPLYRSLVTRLLPATQNDPPQAARELRWMVETLLSRRHNPAHRFLRPHNNNNNNNTASSPSSPPSSLASAAATAAALPTLTPTELARLSSWISRRVDTHTPLQYLLATQSFCNLDLRVRRPTLIPRWETEEWTMRLASILLQQQTKTPPPLQRPQQQQRPPQRPPPRRPARRRFLRILDLCTGTGCIGLALANAIPHAHVTAGDIHPRAVALARINARRNGLEDRVTAQWVDVFDDGVMRHLVHQNSDNNNNDGGDDDGTNDAAAAAGGKFFDLVVANPPYISPRDLATLDPDVRLWEDVAALVADDDGTEFHARIAACAKDVLLRPKPPPPPSPTVAGAADDDDDDDDTHHHPRLVMEIGEGQGERVKAIVQRQGFSDVVVWKDLAGVDRCVVGY